jgi:hypothetical protein
MTILVTYLEGFDLQISVTYPQDSTPMLRHTFQQPRHDQVDSEIAPVKEVRYFHYGDLP